MKKKLEADLISIAHRILKLKNKSELVQLHLETQKLYEKLSVLLFVEENFGDVKPTIGYDEIERKVEAIFESPVEVIHDEAIPHEIEVAQEAITKEEFIHDEIIAPIVSEEIKAEITVAIPELVEEKVEEIQEEEVPEIQDQKIGETTVTEEPAFKPAFELAYESKIEPVKEEVEFSKEEVKSKPTQISFDDLLGVDYVDPVFVKPEELKKEAEAQANNVIPIGGRNLSDNSQVISINKTVSLNDRLSKGITIGLNDRIAFMKHLFANSSEDYNRVLNQLITFDTFQEVQSFINDMVKPDYNNWDGKEEYELRFMEILEKRFS